MSEIRDGVSEILASRADERRTTSCRAARECETATARPQIRRHVRSCRVLELCCGGRAYFYLRSGVVSSISYTKKARAKAEQYRP
ncbi:MAG: hypothetical protein ABW071_12330, partial [Casimicrobiaceae bacterium]